MENGVKGTPMLDVPPYAGAVLAVALLIAVLVHGWRRWSSGTLTLGSAVALGVLAAALTVWAIVSILWG